MDKNIKPAFLSLSKGYEVNPMKMISLWESKTFSILPASWTQGSVHQTAAKLLPVKMRVLKKKYHFGHYRWSVCNQMSPWFQSAWVLIILKVLWMASLQLSDLQTLYHLYSMVSTFSKNISRVHGAGSTLRISFSSLKVTSIS